MKFAFLYWTARILISDGPQKEELLPYDLYAFFLNKLAY